MLPNNRLLHDTLRLSLRAAHCAPKPERRLHVKACYRASVLLAASSLMHGCAAGAVASAFVLHGPPGEDAQKNFEQIVGSQVGKHVPVDKWPVSRAPLPGGTLEWKYRCCTETCSYYYVVDPDTYIVTPVYYAAFVFDPDGNNFEAVFRG